jgi:DNA-binding Lrp family transcriptional regulator
MNTARELEDIELKIYLYLLRENKPHSIREIARALDMAPSSVHYHVRKMVEAGLLRRTSEGYIVDRIIRIEGYIILWRRIIPRLIIYSLFFLGLFLGELIVIVTSYSLNVDRILLLASTLLAFILMFYEGYTAWRRIK